APDPPAAPAGGEESVLAVGVVQKRPDVSLQAQRLLRLGSGAHQQRLQLRDARLRRACLLREVLELGAVIEREHGEIVPTLALAADAMEPGEVRVLVRAIEARAAHEILELIGRGHRSGAGVARHDQRAAGVRRPRRLPPARAREPALEEPGHERIAGAEDVHHSYREAGNNVLLLDAWRNLAVEHRAAARAELKGKHGGREGANDAL